MSKNVCIDCHLLKIFGDKTAISEIMNLLVPTNPRADIFHHSGFYPYTDIFQKTKSNRIINPQLIYKEIRIRIRISISIRIRIIGILFLNTKSDTHTSK